MIHLNLLDRLEEASGRRLSVGLQVVLALKAVLLCCFVVSLYFYDTTKRKKIKKELKVKQVQLTSIEQKIIGVQKIYNLLEKQKQVQAELEKKTFLIKSLSQGKDMYFDFLTWLQSNQPDGIWMNTIKLDQGIASLNGTSDSETVVNTFVASLERAHFAEGVSISSIKSSPYGNSTITKFNLKVTFKGAK